MADFMKRLLLIERKFKMHKGVLNPNPNMSLLRNRTGKILLSKFQNKYFMDKNSPKVARI